MRLMTGDGDRACETVVLDAHGERPGGTQDVPVQHGLVASRGGHRLEPVWLQFFLAGSGTGPRGRVGPPGRREPGDGGGFAGSSLVHVRMAITSGRAILLSHQATASLGA
jgi:hypothetical protein